MISPIVLYSSVVLLSLLAVQLMVDSLRSKRIVNVKRQLLALARKKYAKSMSVVLELNRSAVSLVPLLDYLYVQNYEKLQVVVIVKQTAGSKAQGVLTNYRRRNKQANLRVIKHRKGMDAQKIASTYASNDLVMWLNGNEKLSKDFFTDVSLEFIESNLQAVVPRTHVMLDNTLTTAFRSLYSLWAGYAQIIRRSTLLPEKPVAGVVYRRQAVKKSFTLKAEYSHSVAVAKPYQPIRLTDKRRALMLAILAAVVALTWLAYSLMPHDQFVFFLAISAGLYSLICWLWAVSVREYSLMSRLNLVLVAPFSLAAFILRLVVDSLILIRPRQSWMRMVHLVR